jgi:zinc transporter, ZIP family
MTTLAARGSAARWRLWAFIPLVALVAVVALFAAAGNSVLDLLGRTPPPADAFDVRRVEFHPGEIKIHVTNPQPEDLTIALVTVDDAIVPFTVDGSRTLERLRTRTITVQHDWIEDEPIAVGITSTSGIQTTHEVAAAVETTGPSAKSFFGFGIVGFFVGVVPVALGLLWLPSLRRARPEWLAAFMALTAGLLTFLGVEALSEAFELQGALPSALGGAGIVLLGFALSYATLTFLSHALAALATLVAIGIGLHNFGEGLAIGSSFAFGELALGTFLIVGFMVHNVTEGLGIATAATEEKRVTTGRLALLAVVAGAPAIVGAWTGGFVRSDVLGVLFFAAAAGAAFEVVVEVVRYLRARAPGGLTSGYVLGGFLAGVAVMYATGLLVG